MIGILTTAIGFFKGHKIWVQLAIVVALGSTILFYAQWNNILRERVEVKEAMTTILRATVATQEEELMARSSQIAALNSQARRQIAEYQEKFLDAQRLAAELREARDQVTTELAMTRFETLEAIRDDEDFADWVSWPVPSNGWRLLREASEGPSADQ